MNRWLWRASVALGALAVLAFLAYYAFFTAEGRARLKAASGGRFDPSTVAAWVATEVANLGLEVPEEAPTPTPTFTPEPTGTPTPTPEPTQTPTPTSTPTPEFTPTPDVEAQIQQLQAAFQELAERYDGFQGVMEPMIVSLHEGGEIAAARAAYNWWSAVIKAFDRKLYNKLVKFLKENPDAILIIKARADRTMYCPNSYDETKCWLGRNVEAWALVNVFYGRPVVRGGGPLNAETKRHLQIGEGFIDADFGGGTPPLHPPGKVGAWTSWSAEAWLGRVNSETGTLSQIEFLIGVEGITRYIDSVKGRSVYEARQIRFWTDTSQFPADLQVLVEEQISDIISR